MTDRLSPAPSAQDAMTGHLPAAPFAQDTP